MGTSALQMQGYDYSLLKLPCSGGERKRCRQKEPSFGHVSTLPGENLNEPLSLFLSFFDPRSFIPHHYRLFGPSMLCGP